MFGFFFFEITMGNGNDDHAFENPWRFSPAILMLMVHMEEELSLPNIISKRKCY